MARVVNGDRVTAVKGDSMLSLAALVATGATSTFDVIYVDAGHTVRLWYLGVHYSPPFVARLPINTPPRSKPRFSVSIPLHPIINVSQAVFHATSERDFFALLN